MESRTEQRRGFSMANRMQLVEHDGDVFEQSVKDLKSGINRLTGVGLSLIIVIIGALAAQAWH